MSKTTIEQLRERSQLADEMIATLRRQIADVSRLTVGRMYSEEITHLQKENQLLETEVQTLKNKLIAVETRNGVQQISLPTNDKVPVTVSVPSGPTGKTDVETNKLNEKEVKKASAKPEKAANAKKPATGKSADQTKNENVAEAEPDVSQLDLRVGLIVTAKKHPDADSLYVEEVELGEDRPRTVVSGLVKFVPLDQMQNRLAVLLCNLKPAKMRGVLSEAMVMCASTPEKVEILDPPQGAKPGDRVECEKYPGIPEKQLNPKKKVFEQVAPHLKTDDNCVATYKGSPLSIKDKGLIKSQTLKGVQIK